MEKVKLESDRGTLNEKWVGQYDELLEHRERPDGSGLGTGPFTGGPRSPETWPARTESLGDYRD